MESMKEIELGEEKETTEHHQNGNIRPVSADKKLEEAEMKIMKKPQTELEVQLSLGEGDRGHVITGSKEVKITIDETVTDSAQPPILPLSKISEDVSCSATATMEGPRPHSVEFSEEKDVPEMSTRVYDFDMVKDKTLPRRVRLGGRSLVQFFSRRPTAQTLTYSLLGTTLVVCVIMILLYFLM